MAPSPRTPRQSSVQRSRSRQKSVMASNPDPDPGAAAAAAAAASSAINTRRSRDGSVLAATEPPLKRQRRYIPGGPGGGGRFIAQEALDKAAAGLPSAATSHGRSRARSTLSNAAPSPSAFARRERSTRTTRPATRSEADDEMQISSAAAVAAAVVQSEGYKPREERGWEEFHPNLDIDATFMVFHADDVDGIPPGKPTPATPSAKSVAVDARGAGSPVKDPHAASASTNNTPAGPNSTAAVPGAQPVTPSRSRRTARVPTNSLYATRTDSGSTPKAPPVLPIHNQTPKERLDLKQPQYRKTDRILLFESKTFGQARYVDKAMMNVGYQESDHFIRPDRRLIKASDANIEDELEQSASAKSDGEMPQQPQPQHLQQQLVFGRVEYDMDEQDDMWLENYNEERKSQGLNTVTREVFEITITKVEKEWHALEKRIPKPNPKPPQTHRPRSSSAAAVNGEPQVGEEQDSKCAICDDGDCENTNAIVFCDGCDLAVHQECYGVPFIPEGQWLCRKCQLIGRGVPTCIFCPNSDGAFKQTNSSKWAHLLCAMWIPEVTLGNHTFMEPVMDVEKVPKSRWKLTCYICNQQMGACIQCGNKSCYQAFHVTCARRARLFLRMKNSSGALDVLDGSTNLKALCDRHCPSEYAKENDVTMATKRAKKFYKKTMRDRLWANNQASAMALAARHSHAITEHPPDESQMTGAKMSAVLGDKKGQPAKSIWKLPSGAPIIPQAVFEIVEASLQRFTFLKRKEFVSDICRYWTLKREARRGAALLKRLQLQMESFSSMELTRRNFAAMGPSGRARLERRIEFAQMLMKDLAQLKAMSQRVVEREQLKLESAELEQDFVDTCYFPIHKFLPAALEKAIALDKNVFNEGLLKIQSKVEARFFTTTLAFAREVCDVINAGIYTEKTQPGSQQSASQTPAKADFSDIRDRKRLGKRILKAVQQQLEESLQLEADINSKTFDSLKQELDGMAESAIELRLNTAAPEPTPNEADNNQDPMVLDSAVAEITVGGVTATDEPGDGEAAAEDAIMTEAASEPAAESDSVDVKMEGVEAGQVPADGPSSQAQDSESSKQDSSTGQRGQGLDTPLESNGFEAPQRPAHNGPPTPPQSNGSLGKQLVDNLTDGGIIWYLKEFEPQGTSIVREPSISREDARSVSEELSEIDEDELRGLDVEVNETSVTALPALDGPAETPEAVTSAKKSAKPKRRKATYARRR